MRYALLLATLALACAADPVLLPDASPPADAGPCGGACGAGTACEGGACVAVDAGAVDAGTADSGGGADVVDVPPMDMGAPDVGAVDAGGDGGAVDVGFDASACTPGCSAGQVCAAGACACPPNRTSCTPERACETDLRSDPVNCGACGRRCLTRCTAGACEVVTPDAGCFRQTQCGSRCVDLARDNANCGACGRACLPSQFCGGPNADGGASADGVCGERCTGPTAPDYCPSPDGGVGACTNLAVDPRNCRTCGTRVPAGWSCCAGVALFRCP